MSTASHALRAASGVALTQYGAHAVLFLSKGPRGHELGYGLMVILSGLVEVVVLWLLATKTKRGDRGVVPLVWTFVAANVGHALLALTYFFPLPALLDGAVTACLAVALLAEHRSRARAPGERSNTLSMAGK